MTKRQHRRWRSIFGRLVTAGGEWRLIEANAPERLVSRINRREHPALHDKRGRLEARITNHYVDDNGHKRGDVWARFVPWDRLTPDITPTHERKDHG